MPNSRPEFVSIPLLFGSFDEEFAEYTPIILMDCEYKNEFKLSVGKSILLEPLTSQNGALEAARKAFVSAPGAIGYAVKGGYHS